MEKWEIEEQLRGCKREIKILKAKRNKLNQEGWKINFNTKRGQQQAEKIQKDLETIDNQIREEYSKFSKIKKEFIGE